MFVVRISRIRTKHRDLLCVNFRNQSKCGKTRSKKHRSRTLITQWKRLNKWEHRYEMGKYESNETNLYVYRK